MNLTEKVKIAIKALQAFEPDDEPYYLCYSGGKDSDTIRILAELAGVKYDIVHNLTTVDSPETIQYIKSIPNVQIEKARYADGTHKTMWNLIPKKHMPPTRLIRYCCSELKEHGGKGRLKVTGVRSAESRKRSENAGEIKFIGKPKTTEKYLTENDIKFSFNKSGGVVLNFDNADSRRVVEHCYRTTSTMINPILNWTEDDVWTFLHHYGCQGNPLYQCGYKRIGCIGCPMASIRKRLYEFKKYPTYYRAYIRAFDKMLTENKNSGITSSVDWNTANDVMRWWLFGKNDGQLTLDGFDFLDF